MVTNGQLVAQSPADELLERLHDPIVATALADVLDHAELLAMLVTALDGFVRRGDTIAEALADGARELRGAAVGAPSALANVDVQGLVAGLAALSRATSTISLLGDALVEGRAEAAKSPSGPTGVFGLLRALKDDEVARGLGLLIQVAKALGRKLS